MAKWNPCCFPIVASLKAISVLQLVRSGTALFAYGLIMGLAIYVHADHPESPYGGVIALLILCMLLEFIQFYLAVSLWKGAVQRNHGKCRRWFFGTLILFTLNFIFQIINWARHYESESANVLQIVYIFIDIYSLVAVYAFLDELTSDPSAAGYA